MIEYFCKSELAELQKYKNRTRDEIICEAVNYRLDAALQSYLKDLDLSIMYLSNKNPIKVVKKLGKL